MLRNVKFNVNGKREKNAIDVVKYLVIMPLKKNAKCYMIVRKIESIL